MMPKFHLIIITIISLIINSLCPDPNCRPGDPACQPRFGAPQDLTPTKVLLLDDTNAINKKYLLLPDVYENTSSDFEFRLFQQKVLNFSELGALKISEAQISPSVGDWTFRTDPMSAWLNLAEANRATANGSFLLSEFSSVRIQDIKNPGLAQLTLTPAKPNGPDSQAVVLLKFVMPLPLAARLQLKAEPAKIYTTTNNEPDVPFVQVQEIFNITLIGLTPKEYVQDANRSFQSLPQSKTLQKKIAEFMYQAAPNVSADLEPGVYLKPKANYGLIATLEFRLFNEAGNSTKILYEQGEIYLHRRDQLRFIQKPPPNPLESGQRGDLEFYVRCWDGVSISESSLGPSGDLKINFDNAYGRRPQLKSNATVIQGQIPKVIVTVPYKTDTDPQYQNGFSVGDLGDRFFIGGNSNKVLEWNPWSMGIAVLATGTGNLGIWQYKLGDIWSDFPESLKTGWKLFRVEQQSKATNGGYANTFIMADLNDRTQIQVLLLSPKATIRFKPSNNQIIWSAIDAFRQNTLSFLGWKPNNVSASSGLMVANLDIPECKICNDLGISKEGITICAERYGCDNKLSSMMQMDSCDICGGSNECLDCRHVPRGKAKWVCGVCTEDGSALKDCRGVCNGTYQRTTSGECIDPLNEPRGCDGEYHSTAVINECGICVLGRTGKPQNYSKDICGICNGSNACLGCDGQPNSGKKLDICGLCRDPKDESYNKGCGARMSDVRPKVANTMNSSVQLNATGLTQSTPVSCWLTLISNFNSASTPGPTNLTLPVQIGQLNGTDLCTLTLHWDSIDIPGTYNLRCTSAYRFEILAPENASLISLVNYNEMQLFYAEPNAIFLRDTVQAMTVKITGNFIPTLAHDPYCLGQDPKSKESFVFPLEIRSTKEAYCTLAAVSKSRNLDLRIIHHPDQLADVIAFQKPLNVKVKAKAPKILYAKFGDSALEILMKFDTNIIANGSCQQIFEDAVISKFGNQPTCRFSADEIHLTLGNNHQLNANDQLRFKTNAIRQADAEFFDYLSSDTQITISGPDRKLIPIISIEPSITVSTCSDQVRLSVHKASGDGGRPLTYQWSVIKAEKISNKSPILIPIPLQQLPQSVHADNLIISMAILNEDISYTFTVVACNFLNECSSSGQFHLSIGNFTDNQLRVDILGLDPPVRCGSKRQLRASASMKSCDVIKPVTTNLMFYWEVIMNGTVISTGNDWIFILPANDVEPGQMAQVKVRAIYDQSNDRNFTAESTLNIIFEPHPIWVRLGATTRKQGIAEDLVLDGSSSIDPNRKSQHLEHTWTCTRLDTLSPTDPTRSGACYLQSNSSKLLLFEEAFNKNLPMITIPADTLDIGAYNFTDTVESGSLHEKGTVTVNLVAGKVPLVDMLPSVGKRPSVEKPITFKANVYSMENMTVIFSFVEKRGYGTVRLPDDLIKSTKLNVPASAIGQAGYVFSFTIPPAQSAEYPDWAGLAPNTLYAVRIMANTRSGLVGEEFLDFRTNEPPTGGVLTMTTIPTDSVINALTTLLRLEAKGYVDHTDELPLSYEFGIRTHMIDGKAVDMWYPPSSVEELSLYLASAESSHPTCNRIGYQSMVKVCDLYGSCTKSISPTQPFQVQKLENLTIAVDDLIREIQTDLADGNGFGASLKMEAIVNEKCGRLAKASEDATRAVAAHVLGRLTPASDQEDLVAATRVANELLLRPNASIPEGILAKLKEAVKSLENIMGVGGNNPTGKRKKRQTSMNANSGPPDPDSVIQLLGAYEIIVTHSREPDSVPVYLKGTQEILSQMCFGRDATQSPMMVNSKGSSQPLCVIEARGLFMDPSIVNKNISIAGIDQKYSAQIQLGSGLQETYTLWPCNGGRSTCTSVCLATAVYFLSTESGTTPIADYLFKNGSWTPLTDVHMVEFVDPMSKEILSIKRPDWERYILLLPLIKNGSTGYYACKSYVPSVQDWSPNTCEMIGSKITSNGRRYVGCQCRAFGYVAVFESQPPTAPIIAPNQAIKVSFTVDNFDTVMTTLAKDSDWKNITRDMLAIRMNTSQRRIVDLEISKPPTDAFGSNSQSNDQRILNFVLRPPSRFDWTDSSQLIFRINNTVPDQLSAVIAWQIASQSLSYSPVKRALKNDMRARLITLKILNDYDQTVTKSGSDALVSTLTTQLATSINISRSRIIDTAFSRGSTIMTFTIQPPSNPAMEITAELATWILLDQIKYDELALVDSNGNALIIDANSTFVLEVDRKPTQAPNDQLPIIIGGTVGCTFLLVIILVIILVTIKNRGRRDKVSPLSTPANSPTDSQRNSAQASITVRRISITDDQNGSIVRSRRHC